MSYIPAHNNNFESGRRGLNIDKIVIHSIVGSAASAINTFKNPKRQASAHYIVAWDGGVTQMVRDEDTAFHAGNFAVNLTSIGIEHDDQAKPDSIRPDALYEASSQLVASLCQKYNIPCDSTHIIKHSSVKATRCPAGLDVDRIINRANQLLKPQGAVTSGIIGVVSPASNGAVLNIRSQPNLDSEVVGFLRTDETVEILSQGQGSPVLGNDLWYQISQGFVWSGRINVIPTDPPPVTEERIEVTIHQARAAQVLTEALPVLTTSDGQRFGNEEGLARQLVAEWPKYLQLIIAEKKQKNLLEKLASLLGLGH